MSEEVKITPYISECIAKVAAAEGFLNFDLKIDQGSAVGDGFVGIMIKVTIIEKDSDKRLTVVVKIPPENQTRRQDFGAMALFQREVLVYNEFLPSIKEFQREQKIDESLGFFNFPKCFFAEYSEEKDEAIIIMEDLRESDYKMWNKFIPSNFEHAELLMKALGKLHALSFAMKKLKPEVFERFQQFRDFTAETFSRNEGFLGMIRGNFEHAANTLDADDEMRRKRVLKMTANLGQMTRDLVDPEIAEPYAVLTHGDCWSNNFMYHYQKGKPDRIVLLDWQVTRYCSPVLDLVYFIFACTDREMRAKNFDTLLRIYHKSLSETLGALGGDSSTQFPFTALLRQLKKFGKYGFTTSTFLIPMLTTSNDQLPDSDKLADEAGEKNDMAGTMGDAFKSMMENNKGYQTRMRDIIHDLVRFGYL